MDYTSSMTLGDPEFPPKNGVIIKQGEIFVQENRRFLFAKWKVWRKRFVTLRYRAKAATSLLQIDPPNALVTSSVSHTLTSRSSTEIIDSSGPQDLASAKVLQLVIDEHSEPVILKHQNMDEMNDWLAAFRLVSALGETSSICSDTDSSTWTCSQAAASPVISESPITSFPLDVPTIFLVRLGPCPTQQELGFSVDCDYELHIDSHEFSLHVISSTTNPSSHHNSNNSVPHSNTSAWPLSAVHKVVVEEQKLEDGKITKNIICVSVSK
ncbi:hypothetical protein RvY_01139-2 [Ramazzottius varieornatus]|nr:hypothetical protein RvY_01139-2 [Ramazzottius varieornatus]